MPTTFAKRTSWLTIMLATTAMVGCGSSSSSSDNDDHDGDHDVDQSLTDLPGRLVITAADQPQALVSSGYD